MLRINLLPPYIYEGKRKKQLIAFWSVAAAATVGVFLFWLSGLNATLEKDKADEETAKGLQAQYQTLEGKIGAVKKEIAEVQQKQTFIATSQVYNDSWREGFLLVRDVVNPRIVLNAINFDPTRSSVQMSAFAPSEMDAIKWWMVLLNQNDKFTNVNITLPPHGYQPGGGTATAGAPGGFGGGSMGMPGGGRGMPMAMGASPAGGGSMGGSAMMGGRGPMGGGSMGGMGGGASAAGSVAELEGRTGFDFVCTAGLVKPLPGGPVAPAWTGTGSGGNAAPGGGMGMGGSMGMMGGGMGGMSGGSMGMAPPPSSGAMGGGARN